MSTVREIAKNAGVSTATVSRVLNNHPAVSVKARNKVLSVINDEHYTHSVGRRSTTNVAFMYTGEASLGSPFDAALMQGMSQGMQAYDFDLMVIEANRARQPHETWSQMFLRKGICGAVLRTDLTSRRICTQVAEEGFSSVVVGDCFRDTKVNFICSDSKSTSRDGVNHLIELGHERIAVVTNIVDDSDHRDRIEGFQEAMDHAGLEHDSRSIIRTPATREGGAQALRRLVSQASSPTAVFVVDPDAAVGLMNEARQMGLSIPGQLSVLGFDDADLRFTVWPQLTCVCQDASAMGRAAFDALHDMLKAKTLEQPIQSSLPTWLEIHASTAPPAAE